jgi:hypothetical protein
MAEHEQRNARNAPVVHNSSKERFEINMDGQLSVLEYTFKNHRLFLMHTAVPPPLQSQGLGTELSPCCIGIRAPERADCRCDLPFCTGIRKQSSGIPVVCDSLSCLNPSRAPEWTRALAAKMRQEGEIPRTGSVGHLVESSV